MAMREAAQQLVWSEEEMRYLDPPPRPLRKNFSNPLRRVIAAHPASEPHEQTRSSVVFSPQDGGHGNFIDASYRRIVADESWAKRLRKAHTGKRQARPTGVDEQRREWCELDAATSSDALLMNVFCYPRVLSGAGLCSLLGVQRGVAPEFGYRPGVELHRGLRDRTEIDMRLGSLLVEAKLTESGFQTASLALLERYPCCYTVFDRDALEVRDGKVAHYQLLRSILATEAEQVEFCLMLDARRTDLIACWAATLAAVRSYDLRTRLKLLTWQEITATLPRALREYLAGKYDIHAA